MKLHRIYAIILRFIFHFKHSLDKAIDVFYWPALDLFNWGLASLYFSSLAKDGQNIVFALLSGLLLWLVVYRVQNEVSGNLLEDTWNRNLVNIFVSPLKFSEWIASLVLLGIIKSGVSFVFAATLAFALYQFKIIAIGVYLVPMMLLLVMTGWWMGFIISGIVLRFGTRIQALSWSLVGVISPFAAIYYPVSILPHWAQNVSALVPVSYVFESARQFIATGAIDPANLYTGFFLNAIYFIGALIFLKMSFNSVLKKGLVKTF